MCFHLAHVTVHSGRALWVRVVSNGSPWSDADLLKILDSREREKKSLGTPGLTLAFDSPFIRLILATQ